MEYLYVCEEADADADVKKPRKAPALASVRVCL